MCATDIVNICGLGSKSQLELYNEKVLGTDLTIQTPAMLWGSRREEIIRGQLAEQKEDCFKATLVSLKEYPFCRASLDGVAYDMFNQTYDTGCIIEIKATRNKKLFEDINLGIIPERWTCQIQWQLFCSQAAKCLLIVEFDEKDKAELVIKPDPAFQSKLFEAAKAFWQLIIDKIAPEADEEKFLMLDSKEFLLKAEQYKKVDADIKAKTLLKDQLGEELKDLTDGYNCEGGGVKIICVAPKPCVDWKSFVELVKEFIPVEKFQSALKKAEKPKTSYQKIMVES